MPTDIGALKKSWMQLREERDSYREKFNEQEQKIQRLTRQLENERILNDYIRTDKKRPWERWLAFDDLFSSFIYFSVFPFL